MYVSGCPYYRWQHQVYYAIPQTPGKTIVRILNLGIAEFSPVDGSLRTVFSQPFWEIPVSQSRLVHYFYSNRLVHYWRFFNFVGTIPWDASIEVYENSYYQYFIYFSLPFIIVYNDGSSEKKYGQDNNHPFFVRNAVHPDKIYSIGQARFYLWLGLELFWQGVGLVQSGCIWVIAAGAGLMTLGTWYMNEVNNHWYPRAHGCIHYDENFQKAINYQALKKESKTHEKTPAEIKDYIKVLTPISAIEEASRITYDRFLSAVKEKDKKAIDLQKESSESLVSDIEKELLKLASKHKKAREKLSKEFQKITKHEKKDEVHEKIGKMIKDGVSDEQIENLRAEKYTEEDIQKFKENIHKLSARGLNSDPTTNIDKIQEMCNEKQEKVKERHADIQRISALGKNDQLRELLKFGLVTHEEFMENRDWNHEESSYFIEEISVIDSESVLSLKETGIHSTADLLEKSRKSSNRTKLAKNIEVEKEQIDLWVNIADLMRIKGVSDEYYKLLADLGIKSISNLAKQDSEKLHEQLVKHIEKTKWEGEPPTEELVNKWIESAKETEEIIEY